MTNSKSALDNKSKNIAVNMYSSHINLAMNGTHCYDAAFTAVAATCFCCTIFWVKALVCMIKLRNLFMWKMIPTYQTFYYLLRDHVEESFPSPVSIPFISSMKLRALATLHHERKK